MARGKRKFDVIKFEKLGIEVQVFVVTGGGEKNGHFTAEFASEKWTEPTFAELEKKVSAYVTETQSLSWIAVLLLGVHSIEEATRWTAAKKGLAIKFDRFYIARRSDGSWIRVNWNIEPEHRIGNSTELNVWTYDERNVLVGVDFAALPLVVRERRNLGGDVETVHYLPYSEDVWIGVQWIATQLVTLSDKLDDLVGSSEGRAMIASKAIRLLGSGSQEVA